MKLALFDVDYTLTSQETLLYFFRYLLRKKPSLYFHIPKAITSGVLYKLGVNKEKRTKEQVVDSIESIEIIKQIIETVEIPR